MLSNYQRDRILNHIFGHVQDTPDTTLYAALCKTAPTPGLTGSTIDEADYTGYSRVAINCNQTNFPAAVDGYMANGAQIVFAECTGGDHAVVAMAFCTASSGGQIVGVGFFSLLPIYTGDTPTFNEGDVTIRAT